MANPRQPVRPDLEGYMVPHHASIDGEESPMERSAIRKGIMGTFSCCGTRRSLHQPQDVMNETSMMYAGFGSGEYIKETRYKYIGAGGGTHSMREEEPEPRGFPWISCLLLTSMCLTLGLLMGWLFAPEGQGQHRSTSELLEPRAAEEFVTIDEPVESQWAREKVVLTMLVHQVDWSLLSADEHLVKHVKTEIQQAVAYEVGNDIKPEDITVHLSSGSIVARAELLPPSNVSAGYLRTKLVQSTTVTRSALNSLKMIRGLEDVCTDYDKLAVDGLNVYLSAEDAEEDSNEDNKRNGKDNSEEDSKDDSKEHSQKGSDEDTQEDGKKMRGEHGKPSARSNSIVEEGSMDSDAPRLGYSAEERDSAELPVTSRHYSGIKPLGVSGPMSADG